MAQTSSTNVRLTKRLAWKLAIYTIVAAIVTGTIISLIVITNNFSSTTRDIENNAIELIELTLDSAAEAVFQLDPQLAGSIVSGLMQNQGFSEVAIYDDLGVELARQSRIIEHDAVHQSLIHIPPVRFEYPLPLGNGTTSGSLVAVLEIEAGLSEFYSLAFTTAAVQILQALGLALIIFIIAALFITNPVSEISRKLAEIKPGSKARLEIEGQNGEDELGRLVGSVNKYLETATHYQQQLKQNRRDLKNILDNLVEGVVSVDSDGHVLTFSQGAQKLFGLNELDAFGKSMTELLHCADVDCYDALKKKAIDARETGMHCIGKHEDGSGFAVEVVLTQFEEERDVQSLWTIRDISERVQAQEEQSRLEEQLRHAQKMQAIGTLAGGIAHDFNNILAGIQGYAELARAELKDDRHIDPHLSQILKASNKASQLISRILTYSRKQEEKRKALDLTHIGSECVSLIKQTVPANIKIRSRFPDENLYVFGDESMLHQVLMNLLTNAASAIGQNSGEISLTISRTASLNFDPRDDSEYITQQPLDLENGYVEILVEDSGPGIDDAILHRIFEPYFTTKQRGEGTGFGLAMVHSIIESHGGLIKVKNTKFGARLSVYLPEHTEQPRQESRGGVSSTIPGVHGERIMVVEDNDLLGDMLLQLLESQGYEVVLTVNGEEALKTYEEAKGNFDLVITDQTMPGMSGDGLARAILELKPEQAIILCTGYSDTVTEESVRELGVRAFLSKPVPLDKLNKAIREALPG